MTAIVQPGAIKRHVVRHDEPGEGEQGDVCRDVVAVARLGDGDGASGEVAQLLGDGRALVAADRASLAGAAMVVVLAVRREVKAGEKHEGRIVQDRRDKSGVREPTRRRVSFRSRFRKIYGSSRRRSDQ